MNVSKYFLLPYRESPFIVQEKSKALFYFIMTFLILIPIAITAFTIIQYHGLFGTANVTLTVLLITSVIALILLKKGRFNASANLMATVSAIILVVFLFYNGFQAKNADHLSFTFYMPVVIILTALFSPVR